MTRMGCLDNQHKGTRCNDIWSNNERMLYSIKTITKISLIVVTLKVVYTECLIFIVILSVVMSSVGVLIVAAPEKGWREKFC